MVYFVAQRPGFDIHVRLDPCQFVDNEGVWAGGVDHNWGIDRLAVFQCDACDVSG